MGSSFTMCNQHTSQQWTHCISMHKRHTYDVTLHVCCTLYAEKTCNMYSSNHINIHILTSWHRSSNRLVTCWYRFWQCPSITDVRVSSCVNRVAISDMLRVITDSAAVMVACCVASSRVVDAIHVSISVRCCAKSDCNVARNVANCLVTPATSLVMVARYWDERHVNKLHHQSVLMHMCIITNSQQTSSHIPSTHLIQYIAHRFRHFTQITMHLFCGIIHLHFFIVYLLMDRCTDWG